MGLRKSVFGVASGLVGLLRTRLELLALEAADEKARLLKLLGMAFAALLFLTLAVLVFTVSIAVAFWPTENRYLALGLLAGLYAVLGVGLLVAVRQALLYGPPPFSATLEELGRDAELLDACARRTRTRAVGGGLSHDQAFSVHRPRGASSCCARAAIERESLAQGIASAGRKLEPASLIKGLLRAGIEQCVTLGLAGHRPGAPLSTGQLVAVRHVHAGRQALSPVESRGGRAGGLAAVENLAGSERQGRTSAEFTRPASAVFLARERHPGNRMAFFCVPSGRGGMPRIGIGAHRAASQGSSWMQKSTLPAAPLSRPPVAPALSWKSHRRMPVPVLGAEGLLSALGGERTRPSGVLVPQVALT